MKISKKNIVLASVFLLIGYCSIPIIFNTAVFEDEDYIKETKIQKLDDLSISIQIISDCEHSLSFLPYMNIKYICKGPYKLLLDVKTKNINYTHVLVKSAEIIYSSGKRVIIKEDDGQPLKLFFTEHPYWENGKPVKGIVVKQVFHYFEKLITEKHSAGQKLKVAISLTVMPGDKAFLVEQEFIGKTSKERAGFWRTFFRLPGPKARAP